MNTIRKFNFISYNDIISLNSFYKEILGNFVYDVEYILLINYSNSRINFEHEECVSFTLKYTDINTSILKLHAYLNESTVEQNVNCENYEGYGDSNIIEDDSIIIEDDPIIIENSNSLYLGITDVIIKYYTINKHIS